ncbi:MAG: hypothetical protein SNF33_01545 [Candidatus Algichlamydia australiensis]|nr:hypothetical protein [Chlamydiales bacterium]
MKKRIISAFLSFAIGNFSLHADEAIELAPPPDEESAILPAEPVEYEPPRQEQKSNSRAWKTAGMVLFTMATITAGIAVASSNNGKSV